MASLNFTSFSNNTVADANAVTQNFQNIKNFLEANTVQVDGSVKATTASIDNLAVTTAKIADDAVTADKVANGAVLPVDITGSAGAVAWANVSGKPAIGNVFNDGGTYGINVTGSAGSAATATQLSEPSAGTLYSLGGEFYANGNFGVGNAINSYGSIWYYYPQSSSSTNYIVQRSDGRLCFRSGTSLLEYKENVEKIDSALDLVKRLQPKSFVFKEEHTDMSDPFEVFARRTQRQYGFVVDDILEIDSDLVDHDLKDGQMVPRMWKHEAILAHAVAAIQELSDKVDALQAELDALKNV